MQFHIADMKYMSTIMSKTLSQEQTMAAMGNMSHNHLHTPNE